MPFYPCRVCGVITKSPVCREHKPRRERASSTERGYDARWQRTREAFLHICPVCERCGAKATDVHHVDGLGPRGPHGHDFGNLESLCHPCHSSHSAKEQARKARYRVTPWTDET